MAKAELAKSAIVAAPKEASDGNGWFAHFKFMTEARPPLIGRLEDMPETVKMRLALDGLRLRLQRSYQGMDSGAEAYDAAEECLESLKMGILQEGRGESPFWILALAEAQNRTKEDAAEVWANLDETTKGAVKKHPTVVAVRARLMAEAAAKKASSAKPSEALNLDALFS